MPNTGKIGLIEWRDFKVKFMDIWSDIPDASAEETYQMMIGKMPQFICNWIIEEQEKRRKKAPKVMISPIVASLVRMRESLYDLARERPREIVDRGQGACLMTFS